MIIKGHHLGEGQGCKEEYKCDKCDRSASFVSKENGVVVYKLCKECYNKQKVVPPSPGHKNDLCKVNQLKYSS